MYGYIEDNAHLSGNGNYILEDDPVYNFEPGTTPVPKILKILYHPQTDKAIVTAEGNSHNFIEALRENLGNLNPTINQSPTTDVCSINFDNFETNYQLFADALDQFLSKHRFFMPSLTTHQFSNEGNDEYSLTTKNGHIWIPGYVCHQASYDILLATFDLNSFESYEKLRDHAQEMIRINEQMRENGFKTAYKPAVETIDLTINVEAVSPDKIKADLEKIIEIVLG